MAAPVPTPPTQELLDPVAAQGVTVPTPRPPLEVGIRFFVGTCWAGMVVAALWLVAHNGFWMPVRDDYGYLVTVLTGDQPLTFGWLWERYADYRVPLAKVMNVALLRLSGLEFRAGAVFNVLALGAVALGLIQVAARLRGRPSFADALFPLVLLCWAQWQNLAWSAQLQLILAHVVLLSLLLLVASRRLYPSSAALLAGGGIALLPILGPSTLAYVPALAVWLSYLIIHLWNQSSLRSRTTAAVLAGFLAAALALLAVYFVGFEKEAFWHARVGAAPADEPSGAWLSAMMRIASMALATDTVSQLGAAEGGLPLWFYAGTVLLIFYVSTAVLLCLTWWRQPGERLRAAGLLLLLGGSACLFFALDKVRGGHGDTFYNVTRYAIFAMTPLLCSVYAWVLYGPCRVAAVLQAALFCAAGALLPLNMGNGWRATAEVCHDLQSFAEDVDTGKPSYVLANHNCDRLLILSGDPGFDEVLETFLAKQFRGLRELGVPPFDRMAPDPDAERVYLNVDAPAASENVEWKGDGAQGQDVDASLTYVLPRPLFVLAARVQYKLENDTLQNTTGQVAWQYGGDGEAHFAPLTLVPQYPQMPTPGGRVRWIWINARIDRLRFHPDGAPFRFEVEQLLLLTTTKSQRERK